MQETIGRVERIHSDIGIAKRYRFTTILNNHLYAEMAALVAGTVPSPAVPFGAIVISY